MSVSMDYDYDQDGRYDYLDDEDRECPNVTNLRDEYDLGIWVL